MNSLSFWGMREMLLFRLYTGDPCLIYCHEAPEVYCPSLECNHRSPFAVWKLGHALFICRRVASGVMQVLQVLRSGCFTKIVPSIAYSVSVDVIDFVFRPLTGHVKPCKAMLQKILTVNTKNATFVLVCAGIPSLASDLCALTDRLFPNKNSRSRIIVQNFSKSFCSKLRGSHEALLSLIGQRPVGVRSAVLASSLYASQR